MHDDHAASCPACGHGNPEGARFCNACGATLGVAEPVREERKVISVLFCDLVGFTGRSERLDPEDVRQVLAEYHGVVRDELVRHGGTVEKFIGDAVVALFGAPVVHEDDPERAVRAALAIREAIADLNERLPERDLQVRVGVTTGEVVVSLGARPAEGEGMVSGDVVNTASRLQSAASPNAILVDEATYRSTEREIGYEPVEPVAAKGKEKPVPVWAALAARARFGVDVVQLGRTELVGRQQELELLAAALARARDEHEPQLVTIVGVPGIGKSRLVWELFQSADADPELIVWRQGRSLPYGDGVTYWALSEMVKAHAGILETDADAAAAEKLQAGLAALVEDPSERSWIEAQLRPLVGLSGEGDPRGDRRGESFAAWRRFFETLGAHGPTVLVFEDLQWADDGLLDFVDHLADWAIGVPLLILATTRPELLERRPGWGGGKRNAATVSLSPLSDAETARLVAELLDRSLLPAETQTAILAHAGGNPLYAEEYVRMLGDRPGAVAEALPETVQGIIAARLDALSPEEKSLLQDAAVVGKVFWVGSLATISGVARWEIEERLHALERREFLRRERRSSVGAESEYAFRHVLVRDVAYAQIPRGRRAELHRLAAGWIESLGRPEDHAEMLAHHYLAALELTQAVGESVPQLAVAARRALREAGDRALVLNAYAAAESFYRAAVNLADPSDPERPRLLLALGRARHNTNFAAAPETLEPALEALLAAGDVDGAAEAQTRLGDIAWRGGDQDGGFAGLERASALLASSPPSPTKAYVLSERSRLFMVASRNEEAIRVGREALAMAQALGDVRLEAEALNTIGCARIGLGDADGAADVERAVELANRITDLSAQFRATENLADVSFLLGDLRRSTELREAAWKRARELNRTPSLRWLRTELAGDRYRAGDWDEALALVDDEIAESEGGARHYQETQARQIRALVRMARGDLAGAAGDVAEAEALARRAKDPQVLIPVLSTTVWLEAATSAPETALRRTNELLEQFAAEGAAGQGALLNQAALALGSLGRREELRRLAGAAGVRTRWVAAYEALADADYVRATEIYAEIGDLPSEAYVRAQGAEALLAAGRRHDGEAELARAIAFFRSVGAAADVSRGEALLAATA